MKAMLQSALLILCAAVSHSFTAHTAEYHVSVAGSDRNPGSAEKPFRSIRHAADIMQPGDRCVIGSGEYYETVVPPTSGLETAPITFIAAEGEQVTISGTEPVTGWTRHDGDIWKARMDWSLGKNNQVFFDGIMLDEARWPDNTDRALMTPNGAHISSADTMGIFCGDFPDSFADVSSWDGTLIWANCNKKWTSWSQPVQGYDAAQKKVVFQVPDVSRGSMSPSKGGEFYLVNNYGFLDYPGEWYYNEAEKTLYMIPPDSADPNEHTVTAKRRMNAFDLNGKAYIHVIGLDIHASTIDMENAHSCMVRDIRALYISHSHGGKTSYSIGEKTGIFVSGSGNTIRDSEIAFSVADGILLSGRDNAVVNCWIHDIDYFGCYGTPAKIRGYRNMLSHCTIHDTGRDCVQVSGMEHLVQYNDVFHPGMMEHDLGMLYTVGNDGGGTEIHHNLFHDNLSDGLQLGLYLDNFTFNYVCHHNVCWGVSRDELRFNKPSEYNVMVNNTAFGHLGNWGRWPATDGMFGDIVANNLMTGQIKPHQDYNLACNLTGISEDVFSPFNAVTAKRRPGVDGGIYIPGITDGYTGQAPDVGAYEAGLIPWNAGHDFDNPPYPVYRLTDTPLKNRIFNACFEMSRYVEPSDGDPLIGWKRSGAGNAEVIYGSGGIAQNYNTRDTYISNGVKLSGGGDDGIMQTVTGLEPNTTYVLAAWMKVADAGEIVIGVRDYGGTEQTAPVKGTTWEHGVIDFTTGPESTSATVFTRKKGRGTAFVDNIGLVPSFSWLRR